MELVLTRATFVNSPLHLLPG